MEYINIVYEKYNIPDPLAENPKDKQNHSSTNKKKIEAKDHFQIQLNSAATMKNSLKSK